MRRVLTRMGLAALALVLAAATAHASPGTQSIPDQYIVVLQDTAGEPARVAQEMAQEHGLTILQVYEHSLRGYAARIPSENVAAVVADDRVLYVAEDREVRAYGTSTPTGPGP